MNIGSFVWAWGLLKYNLRFWVIPHSSLIFNGKYDKHCGFYPWPTISDTVYSRQRVPLVQESNHQDFAFSIRIFQSPWIFNGKYDKKVEFAPVFLDFLLRIPELCVNQGVIGDRDAIKRREQDARAPSASCRPKGEAMTEHLAVIDRNAVFRVFEMGTFMYRHLSQNVYFAPDQ